MEILIILIMSIIMMIVLAIILKFNRANIKEIKHIGKDEKLNEITNSLPENEEICKEILEMLNNEGVKIKSNNSNNQASLYIVPTNSIFIANIKNTFTRVQTIAHECTHSVQDKSLLWFNFIFSNIYILYFDLITILTLFKVIKTPNIFVIILVMMSIVLYFIRSYLETDAMIRAEFLAKDYMSKKEDVISKENVNIIIENYQKLNSIGIKFYNLSLLAGYLGKVIVYCAISLIMKNFI